MTETRIGENAPLIEAVERLSKDLCNAGAPDVITLPDGSKSLVWRDSEGELHTRDFEAEKAPARRRGVVNVQSVEGFATAVAILRGANKAPLIAFRDNAIVGELNFGGEGRPDFADFSVAFRPRIAPEWQRWRSFVAGPQKQRKAVEFAEDNAADFAEPLPGTVAHSALVAWLERMSLKVLREVEQSDTEVGDRTTATGSATTTLVTRVALRVYEDGPVLGFKVRWRAGLGEDDRLQVTAQIVNAEEAERRVWLGPVPEGASWRPLVEAVSEAVGLPVIV